MATFETIFPTFLSKCAELHDLLLVAAFALFVVGILTFVSHGFRQRAFLRLLLRLAVLTALLAFLPRWGNTLQDLLKDSILNGLGVDPASVHEQYENLLNAKNAGGGAPDSWFSIIGHFSEFAFVTLIHTVLWLLGSFASYIEWWAYVFQKIILNLGYALSPILIGFMAIHPLKHIGSRYLFNLFGILLWPLGWAVAALVTQGLLDFMTDPSFKFIDPTATIYTIQNAVGLVILAFWVIFSTFAAPIIIQKVVFAGAVAGTELLSGAISTAVQTATTAAGAAGAAIIAGRPALTAAAAATTAGVLTAASVSSGLGNAGVFILAGNGAPPRPSRRPGDGDITGDRAVRQLIALTRSQHAEPSVPPPIRRLPPPNDPSRPDRST
jgi:hypothetical protein